MLETTRTWDPDVRSEKYFIVESRIRCAHFNIVTAVSPHSAGVAISCLEQSVRLAPGFQFENVPTFFECGPSSLPVVDAMHPERRSR